MEDKESNLTDAPVQQKTVPEHQLTAPICVVGSLLLTSLAYALPIALLPGSHPFGNFVSAEVINLYAIVAWMGLSHFVFAYQGQFGGLRSKPKSLWFFIAVLAITALGLVSASKTIGSQLFAALVWIYFIPHFIKAERLFSADEYAALTAQNSHNVPAGRARRFVFVFPTMAFTYFTFVLFCPLEMVASRWLLIGLALVTMLAAWRLGVVQQLREKENGQYALLAGVLLAEGLVWGTYRPYMHPYFQTGLYVFHIALASFYHYLRAYQFALHKYPGKFGVTLKRIISINVVVALVCLAVANAARLHIAPLTFVSWSLDIQTFSVWVALHLIASDIYGFFRSGMITASAIAKQAVPAPQ